MKTLTFFIAIFLLAAASLYSQSGWVQQNTGTTNHILSLYFPNAETGFACGWYGTTLKTTNGGTNWVNAGAPVFDYQSAFFVDVNTGWFVGHNGAIVKTTNSGSTWSTQNSGTSVYLMLTFFVNANTGYIAGYSGKILKTTNGGTNWVSQVSGVTENLLSVKFTDANTGYITGNNGVAIKTTNGGSSWTRIIYGVSNNLNKMSFPNANTGWIPGTNGLINKTTDGGASWISQGNGTTTYFISASFPNTNTGYISGAGGVVVKTANGGANFYTQITPTYNELHWIYFVNELTGWACGYNGTIIKTSSGGATVPTVPILISPVNLSQIQTTTPSLTWSISNDAVNYTVQVSRVSDFSTIADSNTTASTFRNVPSGKLQTNTSYFWRVRANNAMGYSAWSTVWVFSVLSTDIKPVGDFTPTEYKIVGNYPNPFNPTTKILFDIPKSAGIKLAIHDALGRELEKIYEGKLSPGRFEYTWNAYKQTSGVYYVRLTADGISETKRMVLIK